MSKLRVDELESLATGAVVPVARAVVAVDSIADLLALPEEQRKEGLRYLVKGYHAGSDVGGGEFYWDATDSRPANGGTIFGEGVGRFVRVLTGVPDITMYGAVGDGVTDSTSAILAALENHKALTISAGTFVMTAPMELEGHSIKSLAPAPEYYGGEKSFARIVFSGVSGTAVVNRGTYSEITGVWFSQADWTTELDGFRPERCTYLTDCLFTEFNGMGAVIRASADTPEISPYHTVFTRCQFLFNAKHGIAIVNGGNAITLADCQSRWNGSPAKGVQPTEPGDWDGLYLNGKDPAYPPSYTDVEPQGILVTGGDYSYNSRYGQNWARVHDSVLIGGYIENNPAGDLKLGAIYSCSIINPMTQTEPVIEVVPQDPDKPSLNLSIYPNHIIVRGRNYGDGRAYAPSNQYSARMPALYAQGSGGTTRLYPTPSGGMAIAAEGALDILFDGTVVTKISKFRLGDAAMDLSNSSPGNFIGASDTDEGSIILNMLTGGGFGEFYVANGGGANSSPTFMRAPKNSVTSRSINAGGTVNTSGADYAEYEHNNGLTIEKGDIVGFKADGTLTRTFSEAIRFGIKSTNPSFVGGDVWSEDIGERPVDVDAALEWDKLLEEKRRLVDRVAYSGKVPVNVYGAVPGDYIIATPEPDGSIGGTPVREPSFQQYLNAIGRVVRVMEDGRAEVCVITH